MAEKVVLPVSVEDNASDKLKAIAQAGQELQQATKSQADAASKAATVDARQTQGLARKGKQLDRLRDRLRSLTAKEIEHERKVKAGVAVDKQATQVSQQRQRRVERLSRAIATQEDRQEELNRRVKESVGAHRAAANSADRASDSTKKTSGVLKTLVTSLGLSTAGIAAMAVSLVGAKGLMAAYQNWIENIEIINQRLEENSQIVRDNAQARLDFVALRGIETPEDVKKIDTLAALAGRSPGEIARGAAVVQSVLPESSFTQEQRDQLLVEASLLAQSRETPVNEIVKSLVPFLIQGLSAREASNVFLSGVDQAGESDPGRFGRVVAEMLPILTSIGGLDAGEATGFVAGSTGLGIDADRAKTGLKNLVLGLRNPQTPEQIGILQQLGITGDGNLIDDFLRVSEASESGEISERDIISLVGEEGVSVALALADPEILRTFISRVAAVDASEDRTDSIAAERSGNIFTPESIQGLNLQIKQLEARTESERASDTRALEIRTARQALELRLATLEKNSQDPVNGVTPADSKRILEEFDFQTANGLSVEDALTVAIKEDANNLNFFRAWNFLPGIGGQNVGFAVDEIEEARRIKARLSDIVEPVLEELEQGPQIEAPGTDAGSSLGPSIINQTIINGTQINNSTNPATGDRELVRRRVS